MSRVVEGRRSGDEVVGGWSEATGGDRGRDTEVWDVIETRENHA